MKGLSITDSEKKLLFIVLALGMLAAAYFFGFTKLMDQASTIEASNEQDAALLAKLQDMVAKQAETVAETESFKKTIKDVIAKYPVNVPQEKVIYLIQQCEDIVGIDYSSISFSMKNVVANIKADDINSLGCYDAISLPYTATYDQFKALLDYTAEQDDRTTIPVISAIYDSQTGNLKGALTFKMYYLTNTDKSYEEFPETGIPSGMTNIFHSEDGEAYDSINDDEEEDNE